MYIVFVENIYIYTTIIVKNAQWKLSQYGDIITSDIKSAERADFAVQKSTACGAPQV